MPQASLAQPDLAVFGERMAGEDLYGIGGSLLFPLKGYRFDMVAGGEYFFAPSDTSTAWTINLDAHLNLLTWRFLRSYYGAGLNYFNRDGDRVGINLKAGIYIRFTDRLIPYVQYQYRTIPSIDNSYLQVGARLMLRSQ
ncbi:MAG: hypothetical protein R3178_03620 [Rhodothermales bacterium]|nr:hypothetical protein [Rhodothermales bacterium]